MNVNTSRQSARFCAAFALLVFGTALSIYVYYRFIDSRLVRDPYKLSVYEYKEKKSLLLEKTDPLCQNLLKEAYCRDYYDCIMNSDLPLAPYKADVALPTLRVNEKLYMLRESAELRYALWKKAAPEVVLLGSSWMFQGFNRRCFFERYPHLRLIDFTVGHNTPETTKLFLEQLTIRGCKLPPGAVFLYGINLVELAPWYEGNRPGYVQEALATTPNRLRRELHLLQSGINDLRDSATAKMKAMVNAPSKASGARPYLFEVPEDCAADSEKLRAHLCRLEPPRAMPGEVTIPFGKKRLEALAWIAQWTKEHQAKLVLIKLPCSTLSRNAGPDLHQSFDLQIDAVVKQLDVPYFDLSDHKTVGIDDTHFIYPGNLFNPDHLNYDGAAILTAHLLQQLDERWLMPLMSHRPEKLRVAER